jgi:hypothetical protein
LSVLMVNVVIGQSPVRGIRVTTWITRIPFKSKAIRKKFDGGERLAIGRIRNGRKQ